MKNRIARNRVEDKGALELSKAIFNLKKLKQLHIY